MNANRRDFLKGTAWMGLAAAAAGCQLEKFGFGVGGSMQNYAYRKLMGKTIRVGFVGIGGRGSSAVHRVAMIPGVEVTALCDKKQVRLDENVQWLKDHKVSCPNLKTFGGTKEGEDGWKALCDSDSCDVVYCATPWALHQPVALRALVNSKVALVEVTSALTTDECWELVEASEKYQVPCMQLENCVYGEIELLELKLARMGRFGEITHGECAYIHDLRTIVPVKSSHGEKEWRYQENMEHKGNRYPTHGLTPMSQTFGINRGDQFDYLVSLESNQANYEYFKRNWLAQNDPTDPRLKDPPADMGDMNTTLIKTKLGKSIMVQHDVCTPRPYSRINLIQGTRGIVRDYPFQCAFEDKCFDNGAHAWWNEEKAAKFRKDNMHPLWAQLSDIAMKVGGHGGMDFIMDVRWAYCLQNGLPLDMDVYDLAATSCLCELTETSVRCKSKCIDIPDFTRGNWRNVQPWDIVTVDMKKMNFDKVIKDNAALNV